MMRWSVPSVLVAVLVAAVLAPSHETRAQDKANKGKLAWGKKMSVEFRTKVVKIADELGVDPSHLMAIMHFESGLRADIQNKNTKATGLIQFMPSTAKNLGTTIDDLKAMTPEAQLDYVRKYFLPSKGKLKDIDDLYMKVLWPAAMGKSADYILWTKEDKKTGGAYKVNAGLDLNKDGKVTREEACTPPRRALERGLKDENASPLP